MATKSYKPRIIEAQKQGYVVTLLFFWLNSVELAIERVKTRVKEGGHNISKDIISRRYNKGIENLFTIYMPIVDEIMIFDNSQGMPELIAEKNKNSGINIINSIKFDKLKELQ